MVDLRNFQRTDTVLNGIFRGVVEDNADPLDAGRVRVRVRSIHTIDGECLPVEQLPWAEPAISPFWSGGRNIVNRDHDGESPDDPAVSRYNPSPPAKTPDNKDPSPIDYPIDGSQPQGQLAFDNYGEACGTGGIFTVPKRGNHVFVFFEHGNHMNPIYFAMAPNKRDWDYQKTWRNGEIDQKIGQLQAFANDFTGEQDSLTEPRTESVGSDWAANAKVDARVIEPNLFNINLTRDVPDSNRDVTCITSLNGSTIIIDNRKDQEQIYVIHKNYLEFTDKDGNRTEYVGKQREITPNLQFQEQNGPHERITSNDADVATNYNLGVEGNHYVHVLGNYDMFVHGRIHIQCDQHVQIDAQKSVGVVTREGDLDVIVEQGNVNLDVQQGYVDAHITKNLNAHVGSNVNIRVDGDAKLSVKGDTHLLTNNVFIEGEDVNVNCGGDAKISADKVDVTADDFRIDANVHITGDLIVRGTCDVSNTVTAAADLFVQTGINCGGYLFNSGIANLGSPVIANNLQVLNGSGPGRGKPAQRPATPQDAENAQEATHDTQAGPDQKDFSSSDPQSE